LGSGTLQSFGSAAEFQRPRAKPHPEALALQEVS